MKRERRHLDGLVGMAGRQAGPSWAAEGERGQELLAPIPSKSQFSSLVEL